MTIIEKSRDFTPVEIYKLTKNPKIEKLSVHAGEVFEVVGYCLYEDTDAKTGTSREILSLELAEGDPIATNSDTVKKSFHDILDIYKQFGDGEVPYPINVAVISAIARSSGRTYYDIALVD